MATVRQARRSLWLTAVGGWLGAAGVLGWSLFSPLATGEPEGNLTVHHSQSVAVEEPASVDGVIDPTAPVWKRALRRPLFDPPPKPKPKSAETPKKPEPPPVPPLQVRLLGTLAGGERPSAILEVKGQSPEVREAGEALVGQEDVSVVSIDAKQVKLKHRGKEITLTVQEPVVLPLEPLP